MVKRDPILEDRPVRGCPPGGQAAPPARPNHPAPRSSPGTSRCRSGAHLVQQTLETEIVLHEAFGDVVHLVAGLVDEDIVPLQLLAHRHAELCRVGEFVGACGVRGRQRDERHP